MATKRTRCPFYSKPMQRLTEAARRSGDLMLQLHVAGAIRDRQQQARLGG